MSYRSDPGSSKLANRSTKNENLPQTPRYSRPTPTSLPLRPTYDDDSDDPDIIVTRL